MYLSDKRRLIISIACMLCILAPLYFLITHLSDPTLKALKSTETLRIERSFFIDQSTKLNFAQLQNQTFTSNKNARIDWSFDPQAYWIKLELTNNSADALLLKIHFDNPMLDQLDIYERNNKSSIKHSALGWQTAQATLLDQSILNYSVTLAPGEIGLIYSRIETSGIAKTPINIYKQQNFVQLVRSIHLIWGAFIGVLIMISLYNLLLFYGLKERIFLIYIGYIISTLLMMSIVQGFGHYLFPSSLYAFFRIHIINLNYATLIFAVLFALFFLGYHKTREPLYHQSLYYIYLMIGVSMVSFFLVERVAAPIFFIALALAYPLCFWLLCKRYNRHYFWSTLYLYSWAPLLIGAAIQPLELTDAIPYSFIARNIYTVCILFEIVLMAMALSERVRHQKELSIYNATHDLETNLPNRQALETYLQSKLNNQQRFTLCLFEVSGLNSLSPYLSQHQSEELLNHFLHGAERHIGENQQFMSISVNHHKKIKIARIKENVFAVILSEHTFDHIIIDQLVPFSKIISDVLNLSEVSINLTTRFGYYSLRNSQINVSSLLKKAFQALKTGARDGVNINAFDSQKHYSLTLANELKQALNNNQLDLYHQPQITLSNGKIHGSEGLLRWKHESLGYIPVESIISLAEDTGLINQLTLWVIDRACQDLKILIDNGYIDHQISVNVSGSDIADRDFLSNVKSIVQKHSINTKQLNLELTESVMISDYNYLEYVMRGLSELGISVSVDDYGTGYSSLSHILQLPFNELKIDRIFVLGMESNQKNLNIVKTTIEMAKLLNLKVVAEGVENKATAQLLADYQCDFSQGFVYSKPLPLTDYLQWLEDYEKKI